MSGVVSVRDGLNELSRLAPKGYALALRIQYQSALKLEVTYGREWAEHYGRNSYALCDPVISWGLGCEGVVRWSELVDYPDPHDVIGQARRFGLLYGMAVSCGCQESRTIGGFARADREFTDGEMERVAEVVRALHELTRPPRSLTEAQRTALRLVAGGCRYSQAAAELRISESAFKARLKAARERLLARTTTEAIARAREHNLL
ncbi:LuxR family transcriptional regulator [Meinhardsimonia xiamenensis]|jgi:LuxR family transcriptional regulator|uniref:LuxR family transcriptional regulator n=1 Tax=Meinhardsimonia xiamenensis TaxID=990712 RepID=A0A1G9AAQ7_9RHOB|nr:autoinducer binding domain-containing protein [Meinhardsimonia xiamenensis]PRX35485.1 LuxR family transcriptional regulator [Meinhardsimonia xiamenensis]SDK23914.1 LuxR family transcriptional regulator [Meinhardsimonia xiamenensis]